MSSLDNYVFLACVLQCVLWGKYLLQGFMSIKYEQLMFS